MQIVPGELRVFGTSGDYVIIDAGGTKPHILRTSISGDAVYNPGDTIPGYIHRDGTYHSEAEE